jgi:hypothetical protein
MRQILKKYWPGFPSEQPRMDELLASFVNNPGQQSTTSQQGVNWQPTSQRTYQDNISQGWSNSGNIGNVSPEENQKNDSNDWISGVVGFVVLMLIIVFCLKSCGATSGVGDSLWTAIKTFFIRALKFVGIVFGVGFPICWFVMNKGWKRLKAALVGAIFFLLSGSFFSVGGLYGVIFGVMFWIGGIAIWNDEQIPKK